MGYKSDHRLKKAGGNKMCCKNNEESQCCVAVHKDKIVPCALVVLTIAFTIAGFVIGHRFIGKGCCKNQDEE
jgi:hypothetical protein